MSGRAQLERALAIGIYLAVAGLLAYPSARPELLPVLLLSLVLTALAGGGRPGVVPALSLLYVAAHLYVTYASGRAPLDVGGSLIPLLLMLIIPSYLSVTGVRNLGEALVSCSHVVAYILAVAWARSLSVSLALFAGLSVLSSAPVAAFSVTSYSTLLMATAHAVQLSIAGRSELSAVPRELLGVDREVVVAETVLRLSVALAVYALGLLLTRLSDRLFPALAGRSPKGVVLGVLRKCVIAIPLAFAAVYAFSRELASLVEPSVYTLAIVAAVGLVRDYQRRVAEVYDHVLRSRDLAESLDQRIGALEEMVKYFSEGELDSLRGAGELVREARAAIREFASASASVIPSYSRTVRAYERLAELSGEVDRRLELFFEELRELLKASYVVGRESLGEHFITIYEGLAAAYSSTERWRILSSLVPTVPEFLRRHCDSAKRFLELRVPDAYAELFGFRLALRRIEDCSELGVRAILAYRDRISALLMGLERQVDAALEALGRLAEEAGRLDEASRILGVENPYARELAGIYQEHFSHAYALRASDPLAKLSWIVDVRRRVQPTISAHLRRVVSLRLGIEELDRVLASSLEPAREAIAHIDDREAPLVDLLPALGSALRSVFNLASLPYGIGAIVVSLYKLERLRPLIEEYVREGLKRGYEFEKIFPLRDDLRFLWTVTTRSGGGSAL